MNIECSQTSRARERMSRISVAVGQLNRLRWPLHECIMDLLGYNHRPHRYGSIGHPLGRNQDVGLNAEIVGCETSAETPKAGNHFIKNEQDTMLVADRLQTL